MGIPIADARDVSILPPNLSRYAGQSFPFPEVSLLSGSGAGYLAVQILLHDRAPKRR